MKKHHDFFDDMFRFLGLFIAGAIALAIVAGLLYGLIGNLGPTGIRILATAELFAIVLAYWFGHREGNAHRSGLEHGVDLKVSTAQRAPVRPSVVPSASPSAQYNALLPDVPRATIVTRRANESTPVEM